MWPRRPGFLGSVVTIGVGMDDTAADRLRRRIRHDLTDAMKSGHSGEVAALRLLITAVDNAEAVEAGPDPSRRPSSPHVAGAVRGVASTEAARRVLSPADLEKVLAEEAAGLRAQAANYETLGRTEEARRLRSQGEVVERYRSAPGGTRAT